MSFSLSHVAAAEPDSDAVPLAVRFLLQARAEPGVLPRVVELFAKRGLVPQKWHSTAAASMLTIEIETGGLGRDLAGYFARCMRQIVGVEAVLTSETWPAGEPTCRAEQP